MKPGRPPSWGAGGKSGVGTAIGAESCVWFTIAKGSVTETFYPRPDVAQTRCLFLAVTADDGFFSDERLDTVQTLSMPESGVPLYEAVNRCRNDRYRITKRIATDPFRPVLMQHIRFEPTSKHDRLKLWIFLAPAVANEAYGNDALLDPAGQFLIARRNHFAIALTASCGFIGRRCCYQGPDDLWNRLRDGKSVADFRDRADDGNVLLAAELDYRKTDCEFLITVGFGESPRQASKNAQNAAADDFQKLAFTYARQWREYRQRCTTLSGVAAVNIYDTSIAVLKTHQSKTPAGGIVASLGVPWGETKQQILDFRYQLCWTRDAVQAAGGFLAVGDAESAKACWDFLVSSQHKDGHWPQNMWLDGEPHWSGIQMDETALPILLASMLHRYGAIDAGRAWPTIRTAAAYLIQNGPGTEQDRWENDGGYSPYTLAVEIAALLAAADFADLQHEKAAADYFRVVADWWNECVEQWTFMDDHYVRLSTPVKNLSGEIRKMILNKDTHANSPAALALVRFGLRNAIDPRILKTVEAIDRQLKSNTTTGPVWHRYPNDRYGEYDDGKPFDGGGVGRGWPLLAGERAHYEIARGDFDRAREIAAVMERQTSACGFIPEQVWDCADLPDRGLYSGRPNGSAMPLVWAHAEYVKLLRSLRDRAVFDMPTQPVERYQKNHARSTHCLWRTNHKLISIPRGKILRIECSQSARVHWTQDGWTTVQCTSTQDSKLNIHYCDLPTAGLPTHNPVEFTFWWNDDRRWENRAYELTIV